MKRQTRGRRLAIGSRRDCGGEAEKLRTALRLFTAVVGTQASQSEPTRAANLTGSAVTRPTELVNDDGEVLDTGGPQ
jgi:hypothetical protein